jgi:hypothetical protein
MPLDHILLSPALAAANPAPAMQMIRRGLPYRVPLDPREPDRRWPGSRPVPTAIRASAGTGQRPPTIAH